MAKIRFPAFDKEAGGEYVLGTWLPSLKCWFVE